MAIATYVDFDATFSANPITGDLSVLTNERAIRNSCINLALSNQFERPYRETIYSGVHDLLFEPLTAVTATLLIDRLTRVLNNNEPRIDDLNVDVVVDRENKGYDVTIRFRPRNSLQFVEQDFFLTSLF